jgi:hypothetical protein
LTTLLILISCYFSLLSEGHGAAADDGGKKEKKKFKQENRAVRRSEDGSTVYMTALNSWSTSHLSCFSGGLLALGSYQLGRSSKELELGMDITEQCAQSYLQSKSGKKF